METALGAASGGAATGEGSATASGGAHRLGGARALTMGAGTIPAALALAEFHDQGPTHGPDQHEHSQFETGFIWSGFPIESDGPAGNFVSSLAPCKMKTYVMQRFPAQFAIGTLPIAPATGAGAHGRSYRHSIPAFYTQSGRLRPAHDGNSPVRTAYALRWGRASPPAR